LIGPFGGSRLDRYRFVVNQGRRLNLRLPAAMLATVVGPAAVSGTAVALNLSREPTPSTAPEQSSEDGAPPQLGARFAPYLVYDSGEGYVPVSRARYVPQTALYLLRDRKLGRDQRVETDPTPTLETLPSPSKPPTCPPWFRECHYYLQVRGHRTTDGPRGYLATQAAILIGDPRPVVYWHFNPDEHTLQYWFFYVFNYFANWHEGDWEQITLQLDRADEPVRAGFSSHHGGQSTPWPTLDPTYGRKGTHIVVFVARGSHANYFGPGKHHVPECRSFCRDRSNGCGRILAPADYRLIPFEPAVFEGDYGSGNFLAKGLKRIGQGINVSDPQTRRDTFGDPLAWLAGTHPADRLATSWCAGTPAQHP
jgi:hypothetical protein